MHRFLMDQLVAWKNKANRKPLILNGARHTGRPKTPAERSTFSRRTRGDIRHGGESGGEPAREKPARVQAAYPQVKAVRFSLSPYREQDQMRNVPLYAVANKALWG